MFVYSFFFQAEDGIRDGHVTGVQTCALPISIPALMAGTGPRPRHQCWDGHVGRTGGALLAGASGDRVRRARRRPLGAEIGRASCRERGCIWVVAESSTKIQIERSGEVCGIAE